MKLPLTAEISPDKIKRYLLKSRKRDDKSKWLARAGYNLKNWKKLEKDLRDQILPLDAALSDENKYGHIYEIKGKLTGPNGKILTVCSIWMNENESGLIKFITMFPDKK